VSREGIEPSTNRGVLAQRTESERGSAALPQSDSEGDSLRSSRSPGGRRGGGASRLSGIGRLGGAPRHLPLARRSRSLTALRLRATRNRAPRASNSPISITDPTPMLVPSSPTPSQHHRMTMAMASKRPSCHDPPAGRELNFLQILRRQKVGIPLVRRCVTRFQLYRPVSPFRYLKSSESVERMRVALLSRLLLSVSIAFRNW